MSVTHVPTSKTMLWSGRVISALPALGLLASGVMKVLASEEVVKGFGDLGWNPNMAMSVGILEIACTVAYMIPQTAVLGAILLTGYLGGAVATHVRLAEDFSSVVAVGVLVWLGLYFRDSRIRALVPWRR